VNSLSSARARQRRQELEEGGVRTSLLAACYIAADHGWRNHVVVNSLLRLRAGSGQVGVSQLSSRVASGKRTRRVEGVAPLVAGFDFVQGGSTALTGSGDPS
jgi:hypothetical protein